MAINFFHHVQGWSVWPGMALSFTEPALKALRRFVMGSCTGSSPAPGPNVVRARSRLPADSGQFTSRPEALAYLRGVLRPNGTPATPAPLITIHGRPGCGKSILAIHLAHWMQPSYPHAQLYVDLKGSSPTQPPLQPEEALRLLLSQLDASGSTPPSDTARLAAAYRDQLRGKSAIVVLDNAADQSQVTPLLPHVPGCLVLVTSRRSLDGLVGSTRYCLGLMGEPEALALLRRVAGDRVLSAANEPLNARVAALCGYLPLALQIAGILLRSQQVGELVGRLDSNGRLRALEAGRLDIRRSFGVSYLRLSDQERALFRRLRLVVEPTFNAGEAAALLDCHLDVAAATLARLVDEQLVLPAAGSGHSFDELIGLYADERLEEDEPAAEQDAACGRVVHLALDEALKRAELLDPALADLHAGAPPRPSLTEQLEALDWFERERPKLTEAWRLANRLGANDVTWKLATCLGPYFATRGSLAEWSEMQAAALRAANATGDQRAQAWAELGTGQVLRFAGDFSDARQHLQEARDRADAGGWRRLEARAMQLLGCVERRLRRLPEALAWYDRAAAIFQDERLLHEQATTLVHVATVEYELERISADDLVRLGESMRAVLSDMPEALWTVRTLGEIDEYLARVARGKLDLEEAGVCCLRSLGQYSKIAFQHGEARAKRELGQVRSLQLLWGPAEEYLEQSAALFRSIGDVAAATHVESLLRNLAQDRLAARGVAAMAAAAASDPAAAVRPAPFPAAGPRRFGIFISYSQDDTETADRIARLLYELGHPVWYAPWSIEAGQSIPGRIGEALQQNNTLIALLSPRSVTSRWVTLEWESALAAINAGEDMVVVPVVIEPVQVPPILLGIKRIDMTSRRFDAGFSELERFLEGRSETDR